MLSNNLRTSKPQELNLFYPSHDIALANGVRHFNPPAAALKLQEDLASLSDIWNLPYAQGEWSMPLPWGWDWDTRKHLHEAYGVKMTQLPTDAELELLRTLSSRQTTVRLCQELQRRVEGAVGSCPTYLQHPEELHTYIEQRDAADERFVLKSPWSSSGRGLFCSHTRGRDGGLSPMPRQLLVQQGLAVQRKMGGVMGERWIEGKEHDFAMLFFASQTEVRMVGYSLFDNDEGGNSTTYRQGFLLSNECIEQRLTHGDAMLTARLHAIGQAYEEILTELLRPLLGRPWMVGYMGIDMLTYRQDDRGPALPYATTQPPRSAASAPLQIHACVELNLRCTMGVVCRLWYEQHRREGAFRISPLQDDGHFYYEFLPTR